MLWVTLLPLSVQVSYAVKGLQELWWCDLLWVVEGRGIIIAGHM